MRGSQHIKVSIYVDKVLINCFVFTVSSEAIKKHCFLYMIFFFFSNKHIDFGDFFENLQVLCRKKKNVQILPIRHNCCEQFGIFPPSL